MWIKVKVTCKEGANVDQSQSADDVMDGYVVGVEVV